MTDTSSRNAPKSRVTEVNRLAGVIRNALGRETVQTYQVDGATLEMIPGSHRDVPKYKHDKDALAALDALVALFTEAENPPTPE